MMFIYEQLRTYIRPLMVIESSLTGPYCVRYLVDLAECRLWLSHWPRQLHQVRLDHFRLSPL